MSHSVDTNPFVAGDPAERRAAFRELDWTRRFVAEMELHGAQPQRIESEVSLALSHCADAGQHPLDALGDPEELARALVPGPARPLRYAVTSNSSWFLVWIAGRIALGAPLTHGWTRSEVPTWYLVWCLLAVLGLPLLTVALSRALHRFTRGVAEWIAVVAVLGSGPLVAVALHGHRLWLWNWLAWAVGILSCLLWAWTWWVRTRDEAATAPSARPSDAGPATSPGVALLLPLAFATIVLLRVVA